jgi:hypothetical protein
MTDQKNPPINFIQIPAMYITGASITTVNGMTRITLFEADEHTGHPRGCFVASDTTWTMIADLIKKQQEMVAEAAKSGNAASGYNSQAKPH